MDEHTKYKDSNGACGLSYKSEGMVQEVKFDAKQRESSAEQDGQDQRVSEDLAQKITSSILLAGIF